ncbi:MAG TPA: hypothetical protein VKP88_02080, partial [Candidatus Paceibacterota bacterium]|nr:hypothetical protein [Candidatus Paceibacterota bacterium]
ARRISTMTALGTAAGGLTGLNQSGTLSGAGSEAAMGAVFGFAGQGIGESIEAIASTEWARRYIRNGAKESVHEAFQDALVRRFGDDAFEALDEGGYLNIDNAIARARPGETVYDAFPREVQNEINQLVELGQRPGNTDVYYAMGAVYEAAANRASMMDQRMIQSVQDAVGTPTLRNRAELEQYSSRGRQEIGGQLQEVYSRAAGVRFDPQVVEQLINEELARGTLENSGPAIDVARTVRNLLRDVPDEGLTPQAYSAFLQDLDDVIYGASNAGSGYRDSGVQVSSRMMREFLQPLRQGLRQYAYDEIEGLAPLMSQYANEARVNLAYQAGQKALGAAGVRDDAFELFRGTTDRTPMEVEFFAEGVKAELTRQLAGKTPRQIEAFVRSNPERMRQVEVILDAAGEGGGSISQQLMEAVATYQTDLRIAEFAEMAPPASVNLSDKGSDIGQLFGDTLMAAGGLATNVLSSSLGAGAARRLLGRGDEASAAGYAVRRGEAASELATMPPREGLQSVRNTMQAAQPGLAPSVGGILGYGTATTDTAGAQPDTALPF